MAKYTVNFTVEYEAVDDEAAHDVFYNHLLDKVQEVGYVSSVRYRDAAGQMRIQTNPEKHSELTALSPGTESDNAHGHKH